MNIGSLFHRLTLENPTTQTPDGDGGFKEGWTALSPPRMWAAIVPATAQRLERLMASTVESTATHIVTMRFHPGVTTKTRLTEGARQTDGSLASGSREFRVTGLQNVDEYSVELRLACAETIV